MNRLNKSSDDKSLLRVSEIAGRIKKMHEQWLELGRDSLTCAEKPEHYAELLRAGALEIVLLCERYVKAVDAGDSAQAEKIELQIIDAFSHGNS